MLSASCLVELARALGSPSRPVQPYSRLFDTLEPRALLGGDPFITFTDPSGDICRATLQNSGTNGSIGYTTGPGGTILITASSTSPSSRLVISLDPTDPAGGGDRPDIANLITTGVRTIEAPTTDLSNGEVVADRVRSITLGDMGFGTNLRVNTNNPSPRERSSVTVRDVDSAGIQTPGIFERLTARWVTGAIGFIPNVVAGSIVTLTMDGDSVGEDTRVNINTTDTATDWSVKTLRVIGEVDAGQWSFGRPVQSIRVGGITFSGGGQFSVLATQVRIGSIISDASLRGNWSIGSAGKVAVAESFTGTLSMAGDTDSLRARDIENGANITIGRLGQLVADNIRNNVLIVTQQLTSFLVTQSVTNGTQIAVSDGPRDDGHVGTFTIGAELTNSVIRIDGNVKAVRLGGIGNSTFYVGVNDAVADGTLINNASQLVGGNTGAVGSFTIKAARNDPTNFENSFVAMRTVGTLNSTSRYSLAGSAFGFSFQTITSSVSFRRLGSPPVTALNAGSFTDGSFNYNDLA